MGSYIKQLGAFLTVGSLKAQRKKQLCGKEKMTFPFKLELLLCVVAWYNFPVCTVLSKVFFLLLSEGVQCWFEPPRTSQPAGHSSQVINVYWPNIDIVRPQFLVCVCVEKRYWNVTPSGEWENILHVPVSHQSSEGWVFIVGCSLCCLYFIVWQSRSFFFTLTILGRIFSFETVRLKELW